MARLAEIHQELDAAQQVSPGDGEEVSRSLSALGARAESAIAAIEHQLVPALGGLRQAASAGDAATADRSAAAARLAVAAAQHNLRDVQNMLIARDPLRAAKYFSQQAAVELARPGTGVGIAADLQRNASTALARAWEQSLHQAAGGRLGQVGSLASILNFDS